MKLQVQLSGRPDPSLFPSLAVAMGKQSEGMLAPPVIVRIAGLPGSTLQPFSSSLLESQFEAEYVIEEQLAKARSRMLEVLESALPRFGSEARRLMLAVKRDCYNARSLARHVHAAGWAELRNLSTGLADHILVLETQHCEQRVRLSDLYRVELDRENRCLLELVENPRFLRAIALSSPELVDSARQLARQASPTGSRWERKVLQSLLRYLTRAAAKLSPYSTLTTIALGTVREEAQIAGLRWTANLCHEASLVRLSRPLLDLCQVLLLTHPALRDRCRVALNDTMEEIEPGRFRFLRGSHWRFDSAEDQIEFVPSSQVKVNLERSVVACFQEVLADGPVSYSRLLTRSANLAGNHDFGDEGAARPSLARLIEIGFLVLLPPWPTHTPVLERTMLGILESLPPEKRLIEVTCALKQILILQERYAEEAEPEQAVAMLSQALEGFIHAIHKATASAAIRVPTHRHCFYEDVFLQPSFRDERSEGEAVQVSAKTARQILGAAELLFQFTSLYNRRHELIHTLVAFWADRWPGRQEVRFLDLFREFRTLWESYLRFDREEQGNRFGSFNPLGLACVDELNALRSKVFEETQALMEDDANGKHLLCESFALLLDQIPARYQPLVGSSVFVQPAGADGGLWVVNRLFEGTGRYLSRYSVVMEEPMCSRYIAHLAARSVVEVDGEQTFFVDLLLAQGSTTDFHPPQTPMVLRMPGASIEVPVGRQVPLSKLRVCLDRGSGLLRLVDAMGRWLLPVHLSSLNCMLLPSILRLLTVFGPFETRQIFPHASPRVSGPVTVFERLTCGPLVLHRKRWEIDLAATAGKFSSPSSVETFVQVQKWRRAMGLPREVFVYEQLHHAGDSVRSFKPQYLDFSSPSMASLFLAIVKKCSERLRFEEPLPRSAHFPPDGAGEPRAVEIQIDSLVLNQTFPVVRPER